jgi:hypothetical protein
MVETFVSLFGEVCEVTLGIMEDEMTPHLVGGAQSTRRRFGGNGGNRLRTTLDDAPQQPRKKVVGGIWCPPR